MPSFPDPPAVPAATPDRAALVRRGQALTRATLAYNSLEGVLAVASALAAGSIALLGFGIDSFIEVAASLAALWRLRADHDAARRERAERHALRAIGISFLLLAAYVTADAGRALWTRTAPEESWPGIALAVASLLVMPWLARRKREVAAALHSGALTAEARQTDICFWLSCILLVGLVLNATVGWWWADPVAGLLMVPLIAWEGVSGLRGRSHCDDCAPIGPSPRATGLEAFAAAYTAAWCSQDPARVAAHFAPEGSLTINGGPPAFGRAAIGESARGFMTAFPDLVVVMDRLVEHGERVHYHWTLTGTNSGPGGTGQRVRIRGFEDWRLDAEGRIAESLGTFDAAEYARQLAGGGPA